MKSFIFSLAILCLFLTSCKQTGSKQENENPEPSVQQEMVLIPGGSFIMGKEATLLN
jgi:formylglycine-generating enzyme required for sulfatase activity